MGVCAVYAQTLGALQGHNVPAAPTRAAQLAILMSRFCRRTRGHRVLSFYLPVLSCTPGNDHLPLSNAVLHKFKGLLFYTSLPARVCPRTRIGTCSPLRPLGP